MNTRHLEDHFLLEWEALYPDLPPIREATIPGWEEWADRRKALGWVKRRVPMRGDFLWPNAKVIVEIQGATWATGAHSTGSGIERDAQKALTAAADGWLVIPLTGTMLQRQAGVWLPMIEGVIRRRQASGTSVAA